MTRASTPPRIHGRMDVCMSHFAAVPLQDTTSLGIPRFIIQVTHFTTFTSHHNNTTECTKFKSSSSSSSSSSPSSSPPFPAQQAQPETTGTTTVYATPQAYQAVYSIAPTHHTLARRVQFPPPRRDLQLHKFRRRKAQVSKAGLWRVLRHVDSPESQG
jgi:hypothetical protein